MARPPSLTLSRGTLVMYDAPEAVMPLFTWDARSQCYRAKGQAYRTVMETLMAAGIPVRDQAADFEKLTLPLARETPPYPHQIRGLNAWKKAGRQGVVVLPTGGGKTFLAQLAMRDTPRSTLICVPTLDLMGQWYSGLLAAFPDANIGLLGGGSHDETPILIATYDSATRYAEELAGRFALLICDEVHHLPSDFYRTIAEMSLAPYRLGLSATPKRSDGREADLDTLIGPIVYTASPDDLAGNTLAPYHEEIIKVRLSQGEQARYDDLIRQRNDFLRQSNINIGSIDGWKDFIRAGSTPQGRAAMLAHNQAKNLAYGTEGKLRVMEELLANHPDERAIIFNRDNATVYRISREFLIPCITHETPVKERHATLEKFKCGEYQWLVTANVLDEGVDVPEASVAIVLSGTATERQYIQRLGRILRRSQNKHAVLYEVITEGTSEERVSQRRRGQDGQTYAEPDWENFNAPH
ncbi:DEAD/DEAH box helicase [Deinococcus cavernae]|uniref:DEAD/DEAH box helicase n=1 Tax=Deinococcus cavernae TaxID=2320857 RepID=A0A418V990_9DEIO|nr:DEAD/DEAH box helicase family protein [Deinococcus cavernae]RJF72649.1 DEAD/DEAH box helicase [Deinococcus cavernae]